MKRGLNLCSGQRPFASTPEIEWANVDKIHHDGMPAPDMLCDVVKMPYGDSSADYVVIHHGLEHFNLTDGGAVIREASRVLKPGGSMLIFIPDLKALAQRWLNGEITDYIFFVNAMGAWMGHDEDYHRWHYTDVTLAEQLNNNGEWSAIKMFDWRKISGSDFARDWWILAVEAVK